MYQGLGLRDFESLVIKGACLSRIERSVESYSYQAIQVVM